MHPFGVQLSLEAFAEERAKWKAAYREFSAGGEKVLRRLLLEALASQMSLEQVHQYSGLTRAEVRAAVRRAGLNPNASKRFLSHAAATALQENAELLGIDPAEMDLTSPLAYLPMGKDLRQRLESEAVKGVKTVMGEDEVVIWPRVLVERFQKLAEKGGCVIPWEDPDDPRICGIDIRLNLNENDETTISRANLALILGVEL